MWKSHCFKWYFTNNTTLQNNFKACWSEKPGSKNVTFYTCIIAVPTYSQKYLNRNRRKSWLYPSGSISSNQFQAPKVEIQIVSLPLLVFSPVIGTSFSHQRSVFQRRNNEAAIDIEKMGERRQDGGKRTGSMQFTFGDCWSLEWEISSSFSIRFFPIF